jgi:hypothetical protein
MSLPPARTPSDHATHDVELIAALADADPATPSPDRERAERQLRGCVDCSRLHADLLALRDSIATASAPTRPREFVLTDADAARLRPRGWRQALAFFGSTRDGFSRPLALGLTTFGLVALLVTSIPSGLVGLGSSGGATSAELSTVGAAIGSAGPSAAASVAAAPTPAAAPAASGDAQGSAAPVATSPDDGSVFSGAGEPDANDTQVQRMASADTQAGTEPAAVVSPGWSIWQIVAALSLAAGIALLTVRRVGKRLA